MFQLKFKPEEDVIGTIIVVAIVVIPILLYQYMQIYFRPPIQRTSSGPYGSRVIEVIETKYQCNQAVKRIRAASTTFNVVGMDCEWTNIRRPGAVSVLQLATRNDYIFIFRLRQIGRIPDSLQILLTDPTILKVGVSSLDDAHKLWRDHKIMVRGTFDLRFMAQMCKEQPSTLKNMSRKILKIVIEPYDRMWNWDGPILNAYQMDYAASEAQAGMQLFQRFWYSTEQCGMTQDEAISNLYQRVDIVFVPGKRF